MSVTKYFFNGFKNESIFFKIILITSLFFQSIFFIYIPICFECDAATYYNYAKAFILHPGAHVNFDIPPLYPLLLLISGTVIPGTFIGILILQFISGIASVTIFYKLLNLFSGRFFSFFFSLVFIFSGIPFVYSKLILAEQFYLLSMLTTCYFFIKICLSDKLDSKYLLFFYVSTLLSILIRWESFLFLFLGFFFLLIKFYKEKFLLKKNILYFLCVILILFSITVVKAFVKKDFKYIGSIHERSGQQLFWKVFYTNIDYLSGICKKNEFFCSFFDPLKINQLENKPLVKIENGKNTLLLYNKLIEILQNEPDLVFLHKAQFSEQEVDPHLPLMNTPKEFDRLFGKYFNKPEEFVKNIFEADQVDRTGRYWSFIVNILETKVGKIESNKILKRVAREAIMTHPIIILDSLISSTGFIGINTKSLLKKQNFIYNLNAKYHYIDTGFDLGKCATNSLSKHMFNEYSTDRKIYSKLKNVKIFQEISSYSRNIFRVVNGILFIFVSLFFFISKKSFRLPILFFIISLWSFFIIISLYAGGIHTRQEIITLPILLLTNTLFFSNFFKSSKD